MGQPKGQGREEGGNDRGRWEEAEGSTKMDGDGKVSGRREGSAEEASGRNADDDEEAMTTEKKNR